MSTVWTELEYDSESETSLDQIQYDAFCRRMEQSFRDAGIILTVPLVPFQDTRPTNSSE